MRMQIIENKKAVNSVFISAFVLLLLPSVCYATEVTSIVWFTIFPAQYLFIFIYMIVIKLGFRRKLFLVGSFIGGHIFIPGILDTFSPNLFSNYPDIVLAILPSCYWVVLLVGMLYCKKRNIFNEEDAPAPTQVPPSGA